MAFIYFTEQGSKLVKEGNRLIVEKEGVKIADIPLIKIETILLYGNIQITTPALKMFLEEGVDMAFFSLSGKLGGMLNAVKSKNIILRLNHFDKARSPEFALGIARRIVEVKIANMVAVLHGYLKNYTDAQVSAAVAELKSRTATIAPKAKAANLLGVEGSATQVYYGAYRRMFRGELQFSGRNRQPPRDAVNALLSFSYVILGNEITMLLNGCGLDPYLGFYHGVLYGRASLALDLLEPFRPAIDRFVLSLANLGIFKNVDFEAREGGIYLTQPALKRFFRHWQEFLTASTSGRPSLRENLYWQTESLIQCLNRATEFELFRME